MSDHQRSEGEGAGGATYRVAGALTITRAATTQREIDALSDPLTIDLSEIERMDTVGAWLVYRAVRDRGAKVIGASRDRGRPAQAGRPFRKADAGRSRRAAQLHRRAARAWRVD